MTTSCNDEEMFLHTLDLIFYYIDASEEELKEEGVTRDEVLRRAIEAREFMDPILDREARWNKTNGFRPDPIKL